MAIAPVGGLSSVASAGTLPTTGGLSAAGDPFSDVIGRLLNSANAQQLKADQTLEQFAAGQTDSVHDLVLATAKADLSFRLVLEIRNRLIDCYQEISRMQV